MNQVLRQRIFPNRCIKLRPPSSHAPHQILCECPMCNQYEKQKVEQILTNQQISFKKILQQKLKQNLISSSCNCDPDAYEWILNRLLLPTHKIIYRGIDIYIPETLFFKDGEASAIYMNKEIHDYRIKKVKKQKINQTYIQKIMNERRRKYRDQVQILLGQKVVQKKKSLFAKKQVRIDTKDAAVIQYLDKSEQLITQNQLINLMLKRKQDSIWKKILMIKNFITAKDISKRLIKLNFNYDNHLYPDLFSRAKLLMKIYGGNIQAQQKQYISQIQQQNFVNQLLKSSIQVFAEYSLYKIIAYIEYFYDQKINSIQCSILVNQFNRPYIVDVYSLDKKQLVKYNWTQDQYRKKIQEEQNRIFMNEKQINVNPEIQESSKIYQFSMHEKYEIEKQKYGLTLDPEDTTQQKANDKFFSFLHPQFKQDLSTILRTQNISILDFKKTYLGYVPEKKPIVKPFASNFVKTLHNLTPRVRFGRSKDLLYQTLDTRRNGSNTFRSRRVDNSFSTSKKLKSIYQTTTDFM